MRDHLPPEEIIALMAEYAIAPHSETPSDVHRLAAQHAIASLDQPDEAGALRTVQLVGFSVQLGLYTARFKKTPIYERMSQASLRFLHDLGQLLNELPDPADSAPEEEVVDKEARRDVARLARQIINEVEPPESHE